MDKFQVIQPSVLLAPYVKQYWFVTIEDVASCAQRLVPFGCAALIFYRTHRNCSLPTGNYLAQSLLYGITTGYTDIILSGYIDFISIVFQPAGANLFFRMPLTELNNSSISLNVLNDPELLELEKQLNGTTDTPICVAQIEQFLLRRLFLLNKQADQRISKVIDTIGKGETQVERLAESANLCYKQFKRIFTESTGVNPKEFLQIQRFRKLHHLLQVHTEMSISQLAYECGYYDKSHLIRELKQFSGFTPTELSEACDPVYSDYHALFRSAFVDLTLK